MWITLFGSFAAFSIIASGIYFEENLAKLFPNTEKARQTSLAFGNLKVKDKLFVEFVARDGREVETGTLSSDVDVFIDSLMAHDADSLIDNCLWKFDEDMAMNALDYVLNQAATFVGEEYYPLIDKWLDDGAPEEVPEELMSMLKEYTGGYAMVDGHLFSPDSLAAVAYISPTFNSMETKYASSLVSLIEDEIGRFEEVDPDVEILFHGAAVEGAFNSRRIKGDLLLTVCLSLLIICLVIGLCFKNKSSLLLLLAPVVYGAVFSLAVVCIIKGQMSLMAIGLGAVVLGIALSYCIHVLTHYKYVSDPEQVIREQTRPVCLGCLTTIGAFAGLLFTTSELLSDFGLFASFALVGTTFFALVYLPQFFKPESNVRSEKAFAVVDKINSYPLDRKYWLVAGLCIIILVSFFFAGKVGFDSDLNNIGFHDEKVEKSKDFYLNHLDSGHFNMYYAGTGETLDEAIKCTESISDVLDSLVRNGRIYSRGHMQEILIPTDVQQENIDRWKEYWAARGDALPPAMPSMARSMIEADYEPAELPEWGALPDEFLATVVEQSPDGSWMVFVPALMDQADAYAIDDVISEVPGSVVIDPYYYTDDMVKIIHDDFNVVLLISSLFVFIVLLLSFRNVFISLIAFMPMFLSWYVVQGIMAVFGIEFNLINIVISAFIFGVGVDYSIFVMDGLLDKARRNDDRLLTCHKAAILFSAFVLLTVVISLLIAKHPCIKSIGIITIIGMVSTLLMTHTLEPLLFRLVLSSDKLRGRILNK